MKCLFAIIFLTLLHSSPIDPDASITDASTHDASNLSINNCVDPVSGNFFYNVHDLTIEGIEPIHINRSYNSKGNTLSYDGGWAFFPYLTLTSQSIGGAIIFFYAHDSNGGYIKYHYQAKDHYKPKIDDIKNVKNINTEEVSGRTNIKNNQIDLENDYWVIKAGDGSKKYYKDKQNVDTFYLEKELKANGNWIFYTYDAQNRLASIKTTNPSTTKEYAKVEIINHGDNKKKCHDFDVKVNDSEHILKYRYYRPCDKYIHDYFYLNKISYGDFSEECHYSTPIEKKRYKQKKEFQFDKDRAPLLNNILQGINGVKVNYYQPALYNLEGYQFKIKNATDLKNERVQNLFAPLAADGSFVSTYSFRYEIFNTDKDEGNSIAHNETAGNPIVHSGITYVKDLINRSEIIYHYNDSLQINKVEYLYDGVNVSLIEDYFYNDNILTF